MRFNDAVALITELQNWQELHSNVPNKLAPLPSIVKMPSEKDPLSKAQSMPQGRARRAYFSKENIIYFEILPVPPENTLLT